MKTYLRVLLFIVSTSLIMSCDSDDDGNGVPVDQDPVSEDNFFKVNDQEYPLKTVVYTENFNSFTGLFQYNFFISTSEVEIVNGTPILSDELTSGIVFTITATNSTLQVQDYPRSIGDDDPDTYRGGYFIDQDLNDEEFDIEEVAVGLDGPLSIINATTDNFEMEFTGTDGDGNTFTAYFQGSVIEFME